MTVRKPVKPDLGADYCYVDAMALKEGTASLPIASGEQEINVSITVTWAIDNRSIEQPSELAK
jgi:uncharacterized protein YggE